MLAHPPLFGVMDAVYGCRGGFGTYRVLEIVARVPYQTWETATYKEVSRHPRPRRAAVAAVVEFRGQQDNETWHLLLTAELAERAGESQGVLRGRVIPRLMCLGYWHFSWLLYALNPRWSHRLNAEFVRDHPELEQQPWASDTCAGYGDYATVADLLRQVSHDERCHKRESEQHLQARHAADLARPAA